MPAISSLSALRNYTSFTDTVFIKGFDTVSDGGQGEFFWDNIDNVSLDNNGTIIVVTGVSVGRWKRIYSGALNVRWFGAKGYGNSSINDSPSIQRTINASYVNRETIFFPPGTFELKSEVIIDASIYCPVIIGSGNESTILKFDSLSAGACGLRVANGSGNLTGGSIRDLAFLGNTKTIGIEVNGTCGLDIIKCKFLNNQYGVVLNNLRLNEFTEYVVVSNSNFTIDCGTALYYTRTDGNNSFNGSGLRDCLVNLSENSNSAVLIGERCLPYNAPMSFQCWVYGNSKSLIINNSTEFSHFHGTITIESFNTPANNLGHSEATTVCSGNAAALVGGIEGITWFNLGSIQITNVLNVTGPTTQNVLRINSIQKSNVIPITAGTNVTDIFSGDVLSTLLVKLTLLAPSYIYSVTLLATHDGYGNSGYVNIIAVNRSFNGSGWGDPTFSVNVAGALVIENPNYPLTGMTCTYNYISLYGGVY